MKNYWKTILRDLGLFLHVPGIMALLSLPVCLLWGEYYALRPFLLAAIAPLLLGQLFFWRFRQAKSAPMRYALITVALAWFIIPLFAAIPFLEIASQAIAESVNTSPTIIAFKDPLNAIFEAFSGFTSTGLTMAIHSSELPRSLQWWRSFIEWIGGVGVIVLVVSLLEPTTDAAQLYSAEGRDKTIALTVRATVRKIWWIYLLYSIASIFLLRAVGMPWWEALNHGMTGISTGGFSVRDDSIGAYPTAIQMAVILIMIAGGISFPVHYRLLRKGQLWALWDNAEHRALWILLAVGTVLLVWANYAHESAWLWQNSFFQWASALGTCGFNTVKVGEWTASAKLLLGIAMVMGGAAGSTAGGLKLNRVVILYKAIVWRIQRLKLRPHQLMRYELNREVLTETEATRRIEAASVLAVLWLWAIVLGMFVLLQAISRDYPLEDIFFEVASALGGVGLSTGITSPDLPWVAKLTLTLFMWMGRLEVVPVLLLISTVLPAVFQSPLRRRRRRKWKDKEMN
ncbi:MAG: TrkH family potassium uptake protein [Cyanobacteriota bacterium]|nr:TrkH family potassium uptake protein [Cyanobacteriota bacterium]